MGSNWTPTTLTKEQVTASLLLFRRRSGLPVGLVEQFAAAYEGGAATWTAILAQWATHTPQPTTRDRDFPWYPDGAQTLYLVYLCAAKIFLPEQIGINRDLQSKARRADHRIDNTSGIRYQQILPGRVARPGWGAIGQEYTNMRVLIEIPTNVVCGWAEPVSNYLRFCTFTTNDGEHTNDCLQLLKVKLASIMGALSALYKANERLKEFEAADWVGVEKAHMDFGEGDEEEEEEEEEQEAEELEPGVAGQAEGQEGGEQDQE